VNSLEQAAEILMSDQWPVHGRMSDRTVDRHISNILSKLDVPSRDAATAYAYQHRLIGD
jgi:hypothetical protein